MNIFRELSEKPWLSTETSVAEHPRAREVAVPNAQVGLWVFLAVVSVLFMLLIIAYAGRMAFEDWRPSPQLGLLWFNTIVLCTSSLAMHWAMVSARRGRARDMRSG